MFSFFAELPFWTEFESRFNFIAVDYLIYTFEVVSNINQTYSLPYLVGGMILGSLLIVIVFHKKKVFALSFHSITLFMYRLKVTACLFLGVCFLSLTLSNSWAEKGNNRYNSELAKSGIFSFFAAFRNNELDYNAFYLKESEMEAFRIVRNELTEPNIQFSKSKSSIRRFVTDSVAAQKSNVIVITIESFSASFMHFFGNNKQLTPVLDSLMTILAGSLLLVTSRKKTNWWWACANSTGRKHLMSF